MGSDVKRRGYRSQRRAAGAEATRAAIVAAARDMFLELGYARTTVAAVARRAGVNVDTLYATIGRKPQLMRLVLETAISGVDRAVPAEERAYVRAIQAAPTARAKIEIYAAAVAEMSPRTAPVFEALHTAGLTDQTCADLYREITERRAANMLRFAADLRKTGELRDELSDEEVADIVWSTNAVEYYLLLVRDRGWTSQRFGEHLADAWRRLLLKAPES